MGSQQAAVERVVRRPVQAAESQPVAVERVAGGSVQPAVRKMAPAERVKRELFQAAA